MNQNAGGGDGFSDDTQNDVTSSLSSDLELEIIDPPKPPKISSKLLSPFATKSFPTFNHRDGESIGPIIDDPQLLQWVSGQQNNNRRPYPTRFNGFRIFPDKLVSSSCWLVSRSPS